MEMAVTTTRATTEREGKLPRETVLREFVRYSQRATSGLGTTAEAEGRDLVAKMVQTGRITPEEGERLYLTLAARMERSRQVFEERISQSARRAAERITEISGREVEKLTQQLEAVEARLERINRSK